MKTSWLGNLLSSLIDLIWAGILCLLCSLPVITAGASATALYYTIVKCVRHDRGNVSSCFFHSLRSNFRQATLIWLICLLYIAVGLGDAYAFSLMGIHEGDYLGNLLGRWGEKEVIPIDWYGEDKRYEFEDAYFVGIAEYDKYLNQLYGDYMTLPPVEQRVAHVENVYLR